MKKTRITIPEDIAAEILFISDRTCCVCTTPGKQTQIHHIDENPANNLIDNLAVLCFECHDLTMIKGGFGRKLNAKQILKYKSEWIRRVKKRKENADKLASLKAVTGSEIIENDTEEDYHYYKTEEDRALLFEYLKNIITIHKAQLVICQVRWDSGNTVKINQGSYELIDFYQEVLIELSTFYPKGHFENKLPEKYFSEHISYRYLWHRRALEPYGVGTGGSIVSNLTGGNVVDDVKNMIVDLVWALTFGDESLDFEKWKSDWIE